MVYDTFFTEGDPLRVIDIGSMKCKSRAAIIEHLERAIAMKCLQTIRGQGNESITWQLLQFPWWFHDLHKAATLAKVVNATQKL